MYYYNNWDNYYRSYHQNPMFPQYRAGEFKVVRIQADSTSVRGNKMDFFIHTNTTTEPIVCLADNAGFPSVRDLYAKSYRHSGLNGARVTIFFESNATGGSGLAVNIAQEGMNGNFTVIPL